MVGLMLWGAEIIVLEYSVDLFGPIACVTPVDQKDSCWINKKVPRKLTVLIISWAMTMVYVMAEKSFYF